MKFFLFFLLALQLSGKIRSTNGLICYSCKSWDNRNLEEAVAAKEGRQIENLGSSENENNSPRFSGFSCETLEIFGESKSYGGENEFEGTVRCRYGQVCTGLMYDVDLDGKMYRYSNFECSSKSGLEIGYCVEGEHSQTENKLKALGGKISNSRICACDKDRCDPLSLPYPSGASRTTLAAALAPILSIFVIFVTNGVRRFGGCLFVVDLFSLM